MEREREFRQFVTYRMSFTLPGYMYITMNLIFDDMHACHQCFADGILVHTLPIQ